MNTLRSLTALVLIALSVFVLEAARHGVQIERMTLNQTPVTRYAQPEADGPVVVMAHGFAGSEQMMQGYALPLAQAGYRVYVFEFLGHGRHTLPMSGDVSAVEGTTRLLVEQTVQVMQAVGAGESRIALLGHSMATDIVLRAAALPLEAGPDVGPVVLVSAFSDQIDATTPQTLLLITGAWEGHLRAFAQDALRMVDPDARTGDTAISGAVQRRAVAVPFAEHVSVLHSRPARAEAVAWIDSAFGRTAQTGQAGMSAPTILPTGWAILGLLLGLVLGFRRVATMVPALPAEAAPPAAPTLSRTQFAILLAAPAVVAPLVAVPLDLKVLPVLVADYLGLHLLVYGTLQLALLRLWRVRFGAISWLGLALLLGWCALFGFALDRYAANFMPTGDRLWIIAALLLGALPYMLADTRLSAGTGLTGTGLGARLALRGSFLASLGLAVALDFEGLFFLMLIAPVLVLFYLVFGTMGRDSARHSGPLAAGLALGVVLAWALGVSFPLFDA